jgi:hypothetical protein
VPRHRLAVSILLSVAATLLAAVSWPAPASAAAGISVISAGPTGGNPAVLTVEVNDGNGLPISSMTVHLFDSAMTDVYDTPANDMAYTNPAGPASDQIWTATTPITQAQLAPGTYTMTVDAADADETDLGLAAPGPLAFVYATTLTVSSTSISYADRATTVSGQLTGVAPGAGGSTAPVGLGGEAVLLVDQTTMSTPAQIGTTASDGTFSGTAAPNPADTYVVRVDADSAHGVPATGSPAFTVNVTRDATRLLSVKVTPAHLGYGKTGKLTGTAQYDNAGRWTALKATTVQVRAGAVQLRSVRTNSKGAFSSPMPTKDGPGWKARVGTGSPFLLSKQADGTLIVAVPLTVRRFAATLSPLGVLTASGCVQAVVRHYGPPRTRIEIQYAGGPTGPWKSLGKISIGRKGETSPSCDSGSEAYFKGSLPARLGNAYYRADYAGDDHFRHAASKAVHAWKYLTRIRPFSVSPHSLGTGGTIVISGQLSRQRGSWQPYSHRSVTLLYRVKGRKAWNVLGAVGTNASGSFTGIATVGSGHFDAIIMAKYQGDKTDLWSESSSVTVAVNGGTGADAGMLPAARLRWLSGGPAIPALSLILPGRGRSGGSGWLGPAIPA